MPKLGANYSLPLLRLLETRSCDVDWIKLSVWEDFRAQLAAARPLRPCLLHTLPHASLVSVEDPRWTWGELNAAIAACGSPHVALHLEALPADWNATPDDAEILARLIANTRVWHERVDGHLLIENVPFYGTRGTLRRATDPDAIHAICRESGADLLLDLAHARVAAWHRGEDVHDYVEALPLDRVREIHVCGPRLVPEQGLRDRHQEMSEEDYALLEWTLERTKPEMVTLEYGGTGPLFESRNDPATLERQLRRLAEIGAASTP